MVEEEGGGGIIRGEEVATTGDGQARSCFATTEQGRDIFSQELAIRSGNAFVVV